MNRETFWPCACHRRNRAGELTHIRLHPPTEKRCSECGCQRPPVPGGVIDMRAEEAQARKTTFH